MTQTSLASGPAFQNALLGSLLAVQQVWERLEKVAVQEQRPGRGTVPQLLARRIREGTATLEELDSFLNTAHHASPVQRQPLLVLKAGLLYKQDRYEEALKCCNEALAHGEYHFARILKGTLLLQTQRFDEALQSYQTAYTRPNNLGAAKRRDFLRVLFWVWSMAALVRGLDGVLKQNPSELQLGVQEYLEILDKARGKGLGDSSAQLPFQEDIRVRFSENLPDALDKEYAAKGQPVPEGAIEQAHQLLRDALDELELAVRLLSIKDPFEGWRALSHEISKVWPAGVSAVDAIREQRDREWNT